MSITIIETLNWPGGGLAGHEKKVTGDDRFGFDEAAGTAWVLDGATDLGPYRLFGKEESDAAWVAEALNRELMLRNPAAFESLGAYFRDALSAVRKRAEKETRVKLDHAEKSTLPIASGMWMWAKNDDVTFVRMGDCIAVTATPDGDIEVFEHRESADLETETSKKLNAMSAEEKLEGLREIRAQQNTIDGYPIFGLKPDAAEYLIVETRRLPEASHILIMSDGLWRLVDVYGLMTAQELMERAIAGGVEPLAKQLREFEKGEAQDESVRIKKSDDACGVFLHL